MSGGKVLICTHPTTGPRHVVARQQRRVALLSRSGGGRVLSPSPVEAWGLLPGVRHIHLQVPPGAHDETLAAELADRVGPALDRIRPDLVHVMGITAAIPALMRKRAGLKVIIEPGITPSMALRAQDPELPAAKLADLVQLEDKALDQADAVIARSTVEAATLVRRGVPSSKVITVRDPAPRFDCGPAPAMPHCLYVSELEPWSGWQEMLSGLARVKAPWRLSMVVPDDGRAQPVRLMVESLGLVGQVTLARMEELEHRLKAARLVICPLRPDRPVLAGAVVPWGALCGLGAGRAVVAADLPAIRAYTGPGARYFDAGEPGALAEAVTQLLSQPEELDDLIGKAAHIQAGAQPSDPLLADLWHRLHPGD